jgi:F-type H+-transporting ATPase subunit gamma
VLQQKNVEMDFIAAGKKGQQFLARTGRNVIAAFDAFSNRPKSRDVRPVSRIAMEGFLDGTYDHVVLVYSNFISALVQEPVVKVLLPFSEGELKSMINELFPPRNAAEVKHEESPLEYAFEPSVDEALERILPQLVQLQVYQAVLESAASEWSARMLAMRNASDSASDFLSDLTLTYNQSRQSMITSELAELSASKAALDPA